MAYLVLSRAGEVVMRLALEQERITIGRDSDCDIALEDPSISRHHCELTWEGNAYQLTDFSRNGTLLNSKTIDESIDLTHSDQIELGPFLCEYREGTVEQVEVTVGKEIQPTLILKYEPKSKLLTIERILLTVELPRGKTIDYTMDHLPITIGAAAQNAIAIPDDPYISREHCRISATPQGLLLRDGGSRNGTWWHGAQIKQQLLPERGTFQIGKTKIAYQVQVVKEALEPIPQHRCGDLLGASIEMQEIFALVGRVAPSDATVLITGESGTGKELLARALHAGSGRANRAFVSLNCGAIPATIIESELFGHERGAFTGATNQHKGVFEQADGGTLFLDEIGEMPLELQTRLLRVLESKSVRRVGGTQEIPINVRILAATNQALNELIRTKQFREDLYYRLYMVPIEIPPLRARPDDLRLLLDHFVQALRPAGKVAHLTAGAREILMRHPWPGNVRELRHTIERTMLAANGPDIEAEDVRFAPHPMHKPSVELAHAPSTTASLRAHERETIEQAVRLHRGNLTRAAKELGIARSTLTTKVKLFALDIDQIRNA